MPDALSFLAPGPLPLGDRAVEIVASIVRVGDGLVYAAQLEGRAVRLREYAPAGIVRRREGGELEPVEVQLAGAWADGQARFLDQARRLGQLNHLALPSILNAFAREEGGVRHGVFLITRPAGRCQPSLPPARCYRPRASCASPPSSPTR